jgi:hypothetical protein
MSTQFKNQRHAMLTGFAKAGAKGFTDEEAAKAVDNERRGYWVRASELRKKEFIVPVVKKGEHEMRMSSEGGFQGVWKITPEGRTKLREWDKAAS